MLPFVLNKKQEVMSQIFFCRKLMWIPFHGIYAYVLHMYLTTKKKQTHIVCQFLVVNVYDVYLSFRCIKLNKDEGVDKGRGKGIRGVEGRGAGVEGTGRGIGGGESGEIWREMFFLLENSEKMANNNTVLGLRVILRSTKGNMHLCVDYFVIRST